MVDVLLMELLGEYADLLETLPVSGDVVAILSYFLLRHGSSTARRFLRKVEAIILFYIFVFVGWQMYKYLGG